MNAEKANNRRMDKAQKHYERQTDGKPRRTQHFHGFSGKFKAWRYRMAQAMADHVNAKVRANRNRQYDSIMPRKRHPLIKWAVVVFVILTLGGIVKNSVEARLHPAQPDTSFLEPHPHNPNVHHVPHIIRWFGPQG